MVGMFYCAKLLRPEQRQVPLTLSVGGLDGSLPQFFCQKLGIPSAPSDCTLCLIHPIWPLNRLARKRFSRPMKLKRASNKKGKENQLTNIRNYDEQETEHFKQVIKSYLDKKSGER